MITTISSNNKSLVTDEDNPLIDRKYPSDMHHDDSLVLPQIYSFDFTKIPDFSQTVMQIQPAIENTTSNEHSLEKNNTNAHSYNNTLPDTIIAKTPAVKTNPVSQTLNSKIHSKSLSSRQAIAQAKAQAKQIALQKQLEEEQRHAEEIARYKAEVEAALLNPKIHEGLLNQRKTIAEAQTVVNKHAIFGELAQDLQTIQLLDTDINEQAKQIYEKAVAVVLAAQSEENANLDTLTKAVQVIDKFADKEITDALLRKALWLFEGSSTLNISQNSQQALKLLQQAAKHNDNRAEKLLSRLYYAGHLVERDSEMGKHWLDLAALHGHPEAIHILQGIATTSLLKETQREENNYLKKLAIGIVGLIILMILIFVMVKT